ncbi:MAG: tetratricopeptide repeat protein [Ferruginibacter sp.]
MQQDFAQTSKIDSLSRLISNEKKDSNRVTLLWQLAEQYLAFKPDTSLQLAQNALLLAQRIKFTEGESRSLAMLANSQYLLGDYPKALEHYMQKLKIEEKRSSPRNYASALNNIGLTYILLEEYKHALEYLYRADSIVDAVGGKIKEELKYSIEVNIGEAYYRMKTPDSAAAYFNNALKVAVASDDTASMGAAILGKANVLAQQNNTQESLGYYYDAYNYLKNGSDADILCEVSLGLAKAYDKLEKNDSAIYFAKMSYSLAEKSNFTSRLLDADLFLSGVYNKSRQFDLAFSHLKDAVQLKDSIKGHDKIKAAINLSLNEKIRQQEIAEQKIRDKKARSQQLQWSIIAVCIPILFLITLIISRIKIHSKIISFMGVLSLLLLFEFLTLLLHPVIADLTHHVPILELLIFVIIAALLVPGHHKLEHLLIAKLTKKHNEGEDIKLKTMKINYKKK